MSYVSSYKLFSAIAAALMLNACAFAPGQNLIPSSYTQAGGDEPGVEVVVQPISATMIAQQREAATRAILREQLAELEAVTPEAYRIGPGDVLNVTVWDHPELTSPSGTTLNSPEANGRVVRTDGSFFYPYAGTVQAAGLTLDELRKSLSTKLVKFITSPQIDVGIYRFGSQRVYLSGAFLKAAAIPLTTVQLSLSDAIGQAGIDLANADLSGLTLTRGGKEYVFNLDAYSRAGLSLAKVMLKNGDQLQLPYADRKKVYVMGEVNRPLAVRFKLASISLADALLEANGISQTTSKGSSVYVLRDRKTDDQWRVVDVFKLDAGEPETLVLADQFALQAGDMVYVGSAGITRWNRFISQLFPSAGLINTAQNIGNNN